jgi:hypothetical protein
VAIVMGQRLQGFQGDFVLRCLSARATEKWG